MADEPIAELGNRTPLQAACKPNIDKLASLGSMGMLNTIPEGFAPGSEIANLAVLGYDVPAVFEGRGSLEAASMGIPIEAGEMAMRCNLICIEDGKIKNHSAGHISNEEAAELVEFLNKELSSDSITLFPGVSYRHLLKMKGGNKLLKCTPPHVILIVPLAGDTIPLECTSKYMPFGYVHTDIAGHDALMVAPDGGRLIQIKSYPDSVSYVHKCLNVTLDKDGMMRASVKAGYEMGEFEEMLAFEKKMDKEEREKDIKADYRLPSILVTNVMCVEKHGSVPTSNPI